ncbi:beta-1,4-N-acetylgalactosaminyltransferase bre-4-like isoform X2 [Manduca sexta]|uniref:beta-1,4-N-acetylgalactosaminyltransferase bre-4-like isoform X2 n=1 Tax=Manduca sexta TaxID=7130 RepID=UPI00188FF300|nr:beta-1,4-N-acetylgalactosaminyltransferase bre-4-like isoform X2 [Manduca sexta]
MRHPYRKKIIYCGLVIIILIIFLHPDMNGHGTYDFIAKEDILRNLHAETAVNFTSSAVIDCEYYDILSDDTTLSQSLVDGDLVEGHGIREGGEYAPQECKPKYSTAIIVPYRDRAEQLRGFLVYMHTFFRRQRIHYRIFVVEQVDSRLFNRAKLMNIGAVAAMKAGFPCLVLHDVDLLPLRPANIYACSKCPRHMSSSINKFRFVLPYLTLFGGAIAIISKQYKDINGMSNEYFGWGGEDDDLYSRLEASNLKVCRFEPETSRYHMVPHRSTQKGEAKKKLLSSAKKRMLEDGLSSLQYVEVATVLHPLFTHIMVDL